MRLILSSAAAVLLVVLCLAAQPSSDSLIEGYRLVEVASVADAMEQLYGKPAHMYHDMRPVFTTKFAGPA
ncbi:MAG: RraA family protein, partial [Acidobacteria bacterium]|nr:RraA family protein [Acidobacteriota bacterium]